MPTYTTISETADLMQDKTLAFKTIALSDDVDVGYFLQKAAGVISGKLKATLLKPDGTTVAKTATDSEVAVVNASPPKVKVLIDGPGGDIDFVGDLKIFVEFKIDDSWVQADVVIVEVKDDPIPESV